MLQYCSIIEKLDVYHTDIVMQCNMLYEIPSYGTVVRYTGRPIDEWYNSTDEGCLAHEQRCPLCRLAGAVGPTCLKQDQGASFLVMNTAVALHAPLSL